MIRVKVTGFGVFPQIYLTLPRPSIANVPFMVAYSAISSLTMEWLAAVKNLKRNYMADFKKYYDQDIEHYDRECLINDDWDIVSFNVGIRCCPKQGAIVREFERKPEKLTIGIF